MRIMEELDMDEVVDVPDTPDRFSGRRFGGRESMGRDRDSSVAENFRCRASRDILFENHVNGLRTKDNPSSQNGHSRRPNVHPSKLFSSPRRTTSFGNSKVVSSSADSVAPQNGRLFRKAAVDESSSHRVKSSFGVRSNTDKGKSICIDKPSNRQEGTDFFDLTEQNDFVGNSKPFRLNGALKHAVVDDKRKGKMTLTGNFSGSRGSDSFEILKNGSRGREKISESSPNGSGSATVPRETIILSPDSQHKASFSSQRVPGRKCLVKNGCISPQNIAKAEQLKGSSKSIEQTRTDDIINEVVAEVSDSDRKKGKATFTVPRASKKWNEYPFLATSSSRGPIIGEANGVSSSRNDSFGSQGFGPWRTTHNHSRKQDNSVPDVAGLSSGRNSSGVIRLGGRENRGNHQIDSDHSEGENEASTSSSSLVIRLPSGRPRTEKTVTKKPKKQVATSSSRGECSTSTPGDSDALLLGPSRESIGPKITRVQRPKSRATLNSVIEVDELSPPARRSVPQSIELINEDDSDNRAMQVEADEIMARELQEQLYQEMHVVGGEELDEHLAWSLQRENGSNASGAHGIMSHSRISTASHVQGQPRSRIVQSRPIRRGSVRSRVPASSRMAQIRGRAPRGHRRAVSHRAGHLNFPLDMDLDMRLDILEALEAAVGDIGNVNMGNSMYQVQRDFNENDYEMLLALDEQNHHHSGASSNVINNLPQSVVQVDNQEPCAICLEAPTVGETVRHLPCFHKFHKDCIDPWLTRKTSCPVCKLSVT